jgi:hypothetical protein
MVALEVLKGRTSSSRSLDTSLPPATAQNQDVPTILGIPENQLRGLSWISASPVMRRSPRHPSVVELVSLSHPILKAEYAAVEVLPSCDTKHPRVKVEG